MIQADSPIQFKARLVRPLVSGSDPAWAFLVLPKLASDRLPRRGRTTVLGTLEGQDFQATLEPDGQLSHWLRVSQALLEAINADIGSMVELVIKPVEQEPEPELPADLQAALAAAPRALAVWDDTTTIARLDWIHWVTSAKQPKTRAKRIGDACDMLASGKRRVCCFDPSGFYSKALSAPKAAELHSADVDGLPVPRV